MPSYGYAPYGYGYAPQMTFGQPPPAPLKCPTTGIPTLVTAKEYTPTPKFLMCPSGTYGVSNPGEVIKKAVARAIDMLDYSIADLTTSRARVCAGEPPAWPVLSDVTGIWLKTHLGVCIEDLRVWTAGSLDPIRSVAEVIRRLTNIRNLIASNVTLYICNPAPCNPGDPSVCARPGVWAYTCIDPTCTRTEPTVVRLCALFFRPDGDPASDEFKKTMALYPEFQARVIIHETSHLYYCSADTTAEKPGFTIGAAECLSQYVAATNGSPIDPGFEGQCGETTVCGPIASSGSVTPAMAGFGAVAQARRLIVLTTKFRPKTSVRFTGRKAVPR